MSAAEIADNKWELSSTKPPIGDAAGIAQMLLMGGFGLFFVWIIVFSIIAMVTPSSGGLADSYSKMGVDGTKTAE
ncbi:MAG: hypothetical protein JKY37_23120 [Nannocystaceae bacterium]|nr:hypothetical protein [Nannocystaceae bacterium]